MTGRPKRPAKTCAGDITERRRLICEFIRRTTEERGIPPSLREIGKEFNIRSTNGVAGHLAALERQGLITRERGRSRGTIARGTIRRSATVPLLGSVAAGLPVHAPENREGEVAVDLALFSLRSSEQLFALQARGESMVGAHILDGDMLLVREQSTARNGEIVVALVDGESTVKRFFREHGRVRLQPENADMPPILVSGGEFRILGKVIGILRSL